MHCLSATVLAEANLVRLGIQVPQVLIPQHPAIIEGVAVGAVVVTISGVLPPTSIMTVVSLGWGKCLLATHSYLIFCEVPTCRYLWVKQLPCRRGCCWSICRSWRTWGQRCRQSWCEGRPARRTPGAQPGQAAQFGQLAARRRWLAQQGSNPWLRSWDQQIGWKERITF